VGASPAELEERAGGGLSAEYLEEEIVADALAAYQRREEELGSEVLRELERRVLLSVLDRKWREHLYEMDYLQEGITLRGYGQRDPLVEYQREAFDMFGAMMEGIKEESVGFLFNLEVQVAPPPEAETEPRLAEPTPFSAGPFGEAPDAGIGVHGEPVPSPAPAAFVDEIEPQGPSVPAPTEGEQREQVAQVLGQPSRPANLSYSAPTVDGEGGVTRTTSSVPPGRTAAGYANVARNAPCPCGSGRKFKRCHGAADRL
jgi:preprotein translocase subunit SecA